ncbi:MAG: cobalamin B12-binding domain-containing protein [Nitrosomonadales bacterium]|nr:cobalamin B12-binding domain-containing protein [Nitrosomonadales bacterium]
MNQQTKPDQAKITALQQAYKSTLLSVDKAQAEEVLRTASSMFATPLEVAELCLAPVLEQMGDAWENGHLALSQIYMASRISEELVDRILPPLQEMRGEAPKIALMLLEDHHMLGKRLVQSALRLAGIPVLDWQRVTVDELIARAKQERPDLILISALMLRAALHVRDVREGLDRAGLAIPIYVGGAPFRFDPLLWQEVGASAMGANATEAIHLVSGFLERRHVA